MPPRRWENGKNLEARRRKNENAVYLHPGPRDVSHFCCSVDKWSEVGYWLAGGDIFTPNPQCLRQVDCALYIMYITVTLFMRLKDGHQGHFVDKKSATYNVSQSKSKPPFCAYLEGKSPFHAMWLFQWENTLPCWLVTNRCIIAAAQIGTGRAF